MKAKKHSILSFIMAAIVALSLLASVGASVVSVFADSSRFSDVSDQNQYYYNAVYWAKDNSIASGLENGTFGPNYTMTRGQMITFVYRYYENLASSREQKYGTDGTYRNVFSDVASDAYYSTPVAWAHDNGITYGTSYNKFSPDAIVTRAQMVTFLYRASCKFGETKESDYRGKTSFSDVSSTQWYAAAVRWANQNNVTYGTSLSKFTPNGPCKRCQGITFLYRADHGGLMSGDGEYARYIKTRDEIDDETLAHMDTWCVEHAIDDYLRPYKQYDDTHYSCIGYYMCTIKPYYIDSNNAALRKNIYVPVYKLTYKTWSGEEATVYYHIGFYNISKNPDNTMNFSVPTIAYGGVDGCYYNSSMNDLFVYVISPNLKYYDIANHINE